MNVNHFITIKEYDSLTRNIEINKDSYYAIPEDVFDLLEQFLLDASNYLHDFMTITSRRNIGKVISAKNYVGVISIKNHIIIEILPKIYTNQAISEQETKNLFMEMLSALLDMPFKISGMADLNQSKTGILELFIELFLKQLDQIIEQGLKSNYCNCIENSHYLKGKLLIGQQIKQNNIHKERFYQQYDSYSKDCPENRLIKSTLMLLSDLSQNPKNQKKIKKDILLFHFIYASTDIEHDFVRLNIRTSAKDPYVNILKWCYIFLNHNSFASFCGKESAYALLFPMELIFERFTAKRLYQYFKYTDFNYRTQDKTKFVFHSPNSFSLRPDILISKNNHSIILDTKWKRLNCMVTNYGVSASDIYQMFTYGEVYQSKKVILLYPYTEQMNVHTHYSFVTQNNRTIELFLLDLAQISKQLEAIAVQIKADLEI